MAEDHSYSKFNLFVGKYDIPEHGHLRLSDQTRLRYVRQLASGHEFVPNEAEFAGLPLWLVVEDNGFWAAMFRLDT